ncbi:MAG: hypothetical protein AB7P08_14375 [Burkholderiales bacterium]
MKKIVGIHTGLALVAATAAALAGCALFQPEKTGQTAGREYTVTVKNTLAGERLAPILIVGDADDSKIWVGRYVSGEAHTQFTTGNPGPLAAVLGGDQGQPGNLGVGGEVTFTFKTTARKARITAMVHPDRTPDNYVTALVDLSAHGATPLERFDIGDDEGRKTVQKVGPAGTVTIR